MSKLITLVGGPLDGRAICETMFKSGHAHIRYEKQRSLRGIGFSSIPALPQLLDEGFIICVYKMDDSASAASYVE